MKRIKDKVNKRVGEAKKAASNAKDKYDANIKPKIKDSAAKLADKAYHYKDLATDVIKEKLSGITFSKTQESSSSDSDQEDKHPIGAHNSVRVRARGDNKIYLKDGDRVLCTLWPIIDHKNTQVTNELGHKEWAADIDGVTYKVFQGFAILNKTNEQKTVFEFYKSKTELAFAVEENGTRIDPKTYSFNPPPPPVPGEKRKPV